MDLTRHRLRHAYRHQAPITLQAGAMQPLSTIRPGQTVELVEIAECRRLRKRLADLGLNTGVCVRVVQNSFAGPLILAVREDARLAIGRGMAHKIMVAVPDAPPLSDSGR